MTREPFPAWGCLALAAGLILALLFALWVGSGLG